MKWAIWRWRDTLDDVMLSFFLAFIISYPIMILMYFIKAPFNNAKYIDYVLFSFLVIFLFSSFHTLKYNWIKRRRKRCKVKTKRKK